MIFYDPFSSKTDTALWQANVFARIHRQCLPKPAELYTYSASTAVRVALLLAGFFVAEGVGTGPKATTTVAFSRIDDGSTAPEGTRLLGAEWLARWRHSGSKYPPGLDETQKGEVARSIESHPQFAAR